MTKNYDTRKIFIGDNLYQSGEFTNSGGSPVTLERGLLIGRVAVSGKIIASVSTATDGSVDAFGVLGDDRTVAPGETITVTYCVAGRVDEAMVKLTGAETLDTVVPDKGRYRDILQRNSQIVLIQGTELTKFDNQ
ncbi:hypothetical protein [uncultured Dysgonomonas sp.]|uniref:hypothetical protein n=1 Tax=uncultured Dysgonomonas sp. TaxID=206096 RepID=UPI00263056BA|nr:hypothetical protein [uncultured Dysgonomonas sp.]